jgi:two-component system nitrogen regulation response regulator NtrX
MCPDAEISAKTAEQYLAQTFSAQKAMPDSLTPALFQTQNFKEAKREFEREYLMGKLRENNGNISQTAEMLGMERSHLHKKLKTLHIEVSASD